MGPIFTEVTLFIIKAKVLLAGEVDQKEAIKEIWKSEQPKRKKVKLVAVEMREDS